MNQKACNPAIGPLLGMVSEDSVRLSCGIQDGHSQGKIHCGLLRYKKKKSRVWSETKRFRFNRNFYYTGVIEIGGLEAGTEYEYQMGFAENYSEASSVDYDWKGVDTFVFRTRKERLTRLCFGSCLRNVEDDDRVGKVLRVVKRLHEEEPLDLMLWLGDQVYNDKAWIFSGFFEDKVSDKANFYLLYEEFFHNPHVKGILPSVPNLMMMDDHEIAEDFRQGIEGYIEDRGRFGFDSRNKERVVNGLIAFQSYMASNGPIFDVKKTGKQTNVFFIKGQGEQKLPEKFYYALDYGNAGLFMMDTRTERFPEGLISPEQEKALKKFLENDKNKVKLIGSPVTFLVDDHRPESSADNWKRAKEQRNRILRFIVEKGIQNVFFLSGDVHSHFCAELLLKGRPVGVYQLVSGALFWPSCLPVFRLYEKHLLFGKALHGSPGFSASLPLSKTGRSFFAENGVGLVTIEDDKLTFQVLRDDQGSVGTVVIDYDFPLA